MPSSNASSSHHTPGTITLLANADVKELNHKIADVYNECAERYLKNMAEADLQLRIRAYDNHQRLTFGRAQSALIPYAEATSNMNLDYLKQIDLDGPDASYFPGGLQQAIYAPLNEVLRYSVATLLPDQVTTADDIMVTFFCHRVLVRPQEKYKGFLHRDLAPRSGRIGTIIWYPNIRHSLIEGLEFFAYSDSPDVPLSVIGPKEPDYKFAPSDYFENAAVLGYPHNYAHGVLPGVNPTPVSGNASPSIDDFIASPPGFFVKDLVIITFSESTPVEQ